MRQRDCYGNAMAESFFVTLECELLQTIWIRNHAEARQALFESIEGWYNAEASPSESRPSHTDRV